MRNLRDILRRHPLASYRLKRVKEAASILRRSFLGKEPFDDRTITTGVIDASLKRARQKTTAPITVFTDSRRLAAHCAKRRLAYRMVNGDDIDVSGVGFALYAVDKYSNGRCLIGALYAHSVPFLAAGNDDPSSILTDDAAAESALREAWATQLAEGWQKFDVHVGGDFENLLQVIRATEQVPGVYLEVGVYHGSSGDVALRYMSKRGLSRRCVFVDAFDAFQYEAAKNSPDRQWHDTHTDVSISTTTARLTRHASDKLRVEVRKANICEAGVLDDLPQIAVANVDVDLREAVLAAADQIIPRLAVGGVLIVEDAGQGVACVGARQAIDSMLADHTGLYHYQTFSGQHMLVKLCP